MYIYPLYKILMKQSYFEPIVNKLQKKIGKIISDSELQYLQKEILGSNYDIKKFYKLIFNLKQKLYLIPLRKDTYLISYPENKQLNENQINEQYYRQFLHKIIATECKKNYYIWWLKWLELCLHDFDYTEEIEIYTTNKNNTLTIINNCNAYLKSYTNKHNEKKNHPCFQLWMNNIKTYLIENKSFQVWPIELCVLESLYYSNGTTYPNELIKKIIKKYNQKRDRSLVKKILLTGRHHTSINRLYSIALHIDSGFANRCEELIKQCGFKISL